MTRFVAVEYTRHEQKRRDEQLTNKCLSPNTKSWSAPVEFAAVGCAYPAKDVLMRGFAWGTRGTQCPLSEGGHPALERGRGPGFGPSPAWLPAASVWGERLTS